MAKPNSLGFAFDSRGPRMIVNPISRTQDKIWEAVQEAILSGMTPEQFKREVAEAWKHELSEESKRIQKVLLD